MESFCEPLYVRTRVFTSFLIGAKQTASYHLNRYKNKNKYERMILTSFGSGNIETIAKSIAS